MSGDEKVIPLRRRAPTTPSAPPPAGPSVRHDAEGAEAFAPDAAEPSATDDVEPGDGEVVTLEVSSAPEPSASSGDEGALRSPPAALLVGAVEACLFAVPGVVTLNQLAGALNVEPSAARGALEALGERMLRTGAGLRLVEVGDGWQLRTDARMAPWVASIRGGKPFRLSKPALEALSVVAFRQPVTKGAVDDIRGVDSGGVLRMLLERGLVRMLGRSDEPGRPLTYGTTPAFLELFGMRSLADLPTLKDLRQLQPDETPDGEEPG